MQRNSQLDDASMNEIDLPLEHSTTKSFDIGNVYESDWSEAITRHRPVQTGADCSLRSGVSSHTTLCELIEKAKGNNCYRAATVLATITEATSSSSSSSIS